MDPAGADGISRGRGAWRVPVFLDVQDLVRSGVVNRLLDSTGPADVNFPNGILGTDPEGHPPVIGRGIAAGGADRPVLNPATGGREPHAGSDRIAVAFCSFEVQFNPVVPITPFVPQQVGRLLIVGDYDVNAAVIVEVAESRAARRTELAENLPRLR